MNKFELKERLIKLSDDIERAITPVMEPQADEEAAVIRSRVYSALMKAHDAIRKEIYGIY